jgi:hypothetical protein
VTPLVVVLVLGLLVVLVVNVANRTRAGRRSVRSHHRALDTLGHITTYQPQGHGQVPSSSSSVPLPQRQAHVRLVGADANTPLGPPQALTGGWRPQRATGAAPFRRPEPSPVAWDGTDLTTGHDPGGRVAAGHRSGDEVGPGDGPAAAWELDDLPVAQPAAFERVAVLGSDRSLTVSAARSAFDVDTPDAIRPGGDREPPVPAEAGPVRFDDLDAASSRPAQRRLPRPRAGEPPSAVVRRPGADLRAIAALPHHKLSRPARRGRRPVRRRVGAGIAVVVVLAAGGTAAVVVADRRSPAPVHVATRAPSPKPAAAVTPTTSTTVAAPPPVAARLVSTSPGVSTYALSGRAPVSIAASAPCWIEVRRTDATGPLVTSETLAVGQRQMVTGPAWIRLGNPTGVTIEVRGTALTPPVTEGQPYDLQFR